MKSIYRSGGDAWVPARNTRLRIFACAAALAFLCSCGGCVAPSAVAVVVLGDVRVTEPDGTKKPAATGLLLREGQVIETGAGMFVSLQLADTCMVQIRAGSSVTVKTLFNGNRSELYLGKGRVLVLNGKTGTEHRVVVRTNLLTADARGARFSVSYDVLNSAVALDRGTVEVTPANNGDKTVLKEGKAVDVNKTVRVRAITMIETRELALLAAVMFLPGGKLNEREGLEALTKEGMQKIEKLKRELAALGGYYMIPAQLRRKYGRVDIVTDYHGIHYTGVILSRGGRYRIHTPGGIITITGGTVKHTRTLL